MNDLSQASHLIPTHPSTQTTARQESLPELPYPNAILLSYVLSAPCSFPLESLSGFLTVY